MRRRQRMTGWWLDGLIAALMLTFASVPWWPTGDEAAPRPVEVARRKAGPARAAAVTTSRSAPESSGAPVPGEGAARRGGEVASDTSDASAPAAGPDIVVALEGPEGVAPGPVAVHTHIAEAAADEAEPPPDAVPASLAMASGDLGPEPGAVFWFGPDGLERVQHFLDRVLHVKATAR